MSIDAVLEKESFEKVHDFLTNVSLRNKDKLVKDSFLFYELVYEKFKFYFPVSFQDHKADSSYNLKLNCYFQLDSGILVPESVSKYLGLNAKEHFAPVFVLLKRNQNYLVI